MAIWRLVTHHKDKKEALKRYRRDKLIALGWGPIGDLRELQPSGEDEIREAILRIPGHPSSQSAMVGGRCLRGFYDEMQSGDLVILSIGKGPLRDDVVKVTGEYEWITAPVFPDQIPQNNYQHIRGVEWTGEDGILLWGKHGGQPARGWNRMWPLMRLQEKL